VITQIPALYPAISCLEAVAFFRVSKLIRCPYQSQCNPASDRNPAKGKPKYSVNPLYPALKRLPFFGFQSSLIADRRGSAIRSAIETLQKANRSCGRARMATVHWQGIFL